MRKLFAAIAALLMSVAVFAATNINTAGQADLEKLKGIGPVKAKAIIDYRTKNGPFKSLDDLQKVNGIGKATLDKLRPEIAIDGATTAPADKPAGDAKAGDKKSAKPADAKKQ